MSDFCACSYIVWNIYTSHPPHTFGENIETWMSQNTFEFVEFIIALEISDVSIFFIVHYENFNMFICKKKFNYNIFSIL